MTLRSVDAVSKVSSALVWLGVALPSINSAARDMWFTKTMFVKMALFEFPRKVSSSSDPIVKVFSSL